MNYVNNVNEPYYTQTPIEQIPNLIPEIKPDPKSNIRRELTEREKVELEMKKWQKEQKKVLFNLLI